MDLPYKIFITQGNKNFYMEVYNKYLIIEKIMPGKRGIISQIRNT